MTGREIFHTIIFILFGVVNLLEVKGAKGWRKYICLVIGVLALLVALYDILVSGCGIRVF